MSKYRDELAAARQRITTLETKLTEREASVEELEAEVGELNNELAARDHELDKLRDRLEELEPEDKSEPTAGASPASGDGLNAKTRLTLVLGTLATIIVAGYYVLRAPAEAPVAPLAPVNQPPPQADETTEPEVATPAPSATPSAKDCGCAPEDWSCQARCASTSFHAPSPAPAPLDKEAVKDGLTAAVKDAQRCRADAGPTGKSAVTVTFKSDGAVRSVTVGKPFAGSTLEPCIIKAFEAIEIPPFDGSDFVVKKTFRHGGSPNSDPDIEW